MVQHSQHVFAVRSLFSKTVHSRAHEENETCFSNMYDKTNNTCESPMAETQSPEGHRNGHPGKMTGNQLVTWNEMRGYIKQQVASGGDSILAPSSPAAKTNVWNQLPINMNKMNTCQNLTPRLLFNIILVMCFSWKLSANRLQYLNMCVLNLLLKAAIRCQNASLLRASEMPCTDFAPCVTSCKSQALPNLRLDTKRSIPTVLAKRLASSQWLGMESDSETRKWSQMHWPSGCFPKWFDEMLLLCRMEIWGVIYWLVFS